MMDNTDMDFDLEEVREHLRAERGTVSVEFLHQALMAERRRCVKEFREIHRAGVLQAWTNGRSVGVAYGLERGKKRAEEERAKIERQRTEQDAWRVRLTQEEEALKGLNAEWYQKGLAQGLKDGRAARADARLKEKERTERHRINMASHHKSRERAAKQGLRIALRALREVGGLTYWNALESVSLVWRGFGADSFINYDADDGLRTDRYGLVIE
jgi:hypothetical protein